MIKATFKNSGIFKFTFSIIGIIFIAFFTTALTASVFFGSHILKRGDFPTSFATIYIIIFYTLILVFTKSILDRAYIIKIDPIHSSIYFKNLITQRSQLYQLDEFESYFDIYRSTKAGNFKEIYLIKNNKAEKIISGLYYSNLDEIQQAISAIKYNGFQQGEARITRQALLNQSITFKK